MRWLSVGRAAVIFCGSRDPVGSGYVTAVCGRPSCGSAGSDTHNYIHPKAHSPGLGFRSLGV